jgi:sn-glycerol 3-phosphate transport system ATP-binding protein
MSRIRAENVSKVWGPVRAVDGVSLEAEAGSFLVLLGPSGCGKSTTLRLIAGLERATTGRIWIGGADVTDLPPAARQLSMVFQSYALFPHLSVRENIVFGLKVRRVPAREREARLVRVADLLGIAHLLARKPAQLSGGQQQRVALGRAIIAEKPVCLMDEPLSNLDAQLRQEMRREIRQLQQRLGMTMVYVTHDQGEAMSMADRIVVLRDGRVEQDGTPEAIYARPATAFVAGFIGTPPMNLVRLQPSARGLVIRGSEALVQADDGRGELLLGLRPEELRLADRGVSAQVRDGEYLGSDTILTCAVGDETLKVRAPGRVPVAAGALVRLTWSPDATHVFAAGSGARCDTAPCLTTT